MIPADSLVSVITVNYNGWRDTCEMIASFRKHETYPYEMIVVDNASSGDDADRIAELCPDVKLVRSEKNLGFAGGNNLGLPYARGEYVFFLNNDVIIEAPILQTLAACLSEGRWGGVSPCIEFLHQPGEIQYYGCTDMTPITLRHTIEPFDPSRRDDFLHPHETDVLHGCAMMVRRDVIERAGPMFEGYFLFYEEFDWSLRMREAGYKLFYEPRAVVYHKEGATIVKQSPLREYYLRRARVMYARRNVRSFRRWLSCLYLLGVVMPGKIIGHLKNLCPDLAAAVWRGTWSGLSVRGCHSYKRAGD